MAISLILTLSKNGSLGEESTLSWTVNEDKKWFQNVTKQIGTVVMGRKTFETMGNKPLLERVNYVITHDPKKITKSELVIPVTLEEFRTLKLKDYCVVGGYEIYKEFWKDMTILYVSRHKNVDVEGRKFDLDLASCVLFDEKESDDLVKEIYIQHPYLASSLKYVYEESTFLDQAKEVMQKESLDKGWPVGLVYVKDDRVISWGANGSTYHDEHGCERRRLNIPTGQGYELCEGCHPKNHAEAKGVYKAKELGVYEDLKGAISYMYGHWWACENCTNFMLEAGIVKVVMSKSWTQNYFKILDL